MSKVTLIILGLVIVVMGVLALIPSIDLADEPTWHSIVKVVVGALAVIIAIADRKKMAPAAPKVE